MAKLGVRYGSNEVLSDVNFHAGRGDHIVIIGRNGAGQVLAAALPGRGPGPIERRGRAREPTSTLGYFAQEHEQIDPDLHRAGQRERRRAQGREGAAGPARLVRPAVEGGRPDARRRCRAASGPSSGWPCSRRARPTCLLLDEPTNNLDPSSITAVGTMLGDWPGTIVAVSHERGFVEALRPTYCLRLPEERFTHWREEYLDDVEMR